MNNLKPDLRQVQIPRIDRPEKFYDHFADRYELLFSDLKQDSQHLVESLLFPLFDRFGCRAIVDIGCGTGYDLTALRAIVQQREDERGWVLTGIDISEPMVKQAQKEPSDIRFVGGGDWDISSEDFLHIFRGPKGKSALQVREYDAAICMANTLCHIAPDKIQTVFTNVAGMLKPGGLFVVEFRDGDRLKDHIRNSPFKVRTSDGNETTCAYEHRSITHGTNGKLQDAFFRYLWFNEDSFTINTYFVEFEDTSTYHANTLSANASVTCVWSMNVGYVFSKRVRRCLVNAGFTTKSDTKYRSVLNFGKILLGIRE